MSSDPRTVKLYKPVADKLETLHIDNFNFWINYLLAEKLGIDPQIIEAYRREKADKHDD